MHAGAHLGRWSAAVRCQRGTLADRSCLKRAAADPQSPKQGRPAAVIVGHEEYESLIETLNILADSDTVAAIAEAEADLAAGDLVPLGVHDELRLARLARQKQLAAAAHRSRASARLLIAPPRVQARMRCDLGVGWKPDWRLRLITDPEGRNQLFDPAGVN